MYIVGKTKNIRTSFRNR